MGKRTQRTGEATGGSRLLREEEALYHVKVYNPASVQFAEDFKRGGEGELDFGPNFLMCVGAHLFSSSSSSQSLGFHYKLTRGACSRAKAM